VNACPKGAFRFQTGILEDRAFWFGALNGNAEAFRFCDAICRISNTWDDLIDRDRAITPGEVNSAFWTALADLPMNLFYQQHFTQLYPLVLNGMLAYLTSLTYEDTRDPHGLELAHGLRYLVANAITQAVYLCGGVDHALRVLPEVYKKLCHERIAHYLEEFKPCQAVATAADKARQ
jgi:hypothetical protein